jgi:hypothetical protein
MHSTRRGSQIRGEMLYEFMMVAVIISIALSPFQFIDKEEVRMWLVIIGTY